MACILVIDDEQPMREMLSQILTSAGYKVMEAATSEEGIEQFQKNPTDLVITDLFIPAKGGLEVIRQLKNGQPDVKIIAISGVQIDKELEVGSLATQFGAIRALKKPFRPKELLETIQDVLA